MAEGCRIIAEAGVNHNGDPAMALRLIDAAAQAGADAVKFQLFATDRLVTAEAPRAEYQAANTGSDHSQAAMLRELELPGLAWPRLVAHAAARGIEFLCTPFDLASVELLEKLGVKAYKIGSGDLTYHDLLRRVARTGKPMFLSTGMATLTEVQAAVHAVRHEHPACDLRLLHCVSSYPASPADMNLRAMATMRQALRAPVGLSDHTLGIEVALAAAALGACVIEKHLTLDPTMPGPDHRASLTPAAFEAMVRGVRAVESALGDGEKEPRASELSVRALVRRSLVAARDLPAGATLSGEDVIALRPAGGVDPNDLSRVVGRSLARAVQAGATLRWSDLREG